jgi:hypothetical protein
VTRVAAGAAVLALAGAYLPHRMLYMRMCTAVGLMATIGGVVRRHIHSGELVDWQEQAVRAVLARGSGLGTCNGPASAQIQHKR